MEKDRRDFLKFPSPLTWSNDAKRNSYLSKTTKKEKKNFRTKLSKAFYNFTIQIKEDHCKFFMSHKFNSFSSFANKNKNKSQQKRPGK